MNLSTGSDIKGENETATTTSKSFKHNIEQQRKNDSTQIFRFQSISFSAVYFQKNTVWILLKNMPFSLKNCKGWNKEKKGEAKGVSESH